MKTKNTKNVLTAKKETNEIFSNFNQICHNSRRNEGSTIYDKV